MHGGVPQNLKNPLPFYHAAQHARPNLPVTLSPNPTLPEPHIARAKALHLLMFNTQKRLFKIFFWLLESTTLFRGNPKVEVKLRILGFQYSDDQCNHMMRVQISNTNILQGNSKSKNNNHEDAGVKETEMYVTDGMFCMNRTTSAPKSVLRKMLRLVS